MLPNVSKLRTQPPDRPLDDQVIVNGDEDQFPSLNINRVNRGPLPNATRQNNEEENSSKSECQGKVQRIAGSFTGESSLVLREEEWMEDDEIVLETKQQESQSYKEALSPKSTKNKDKADKGKDEVWDGNLIFEDDTELRDGVKVEDSEGGVHIMFLEDEKRRLETRWENALIVKILGGNIGVHTAQEEDSDDVG